MVMTDKTSRRMDVAEALSVHIKKWREVESLLRRGTEKGEVDMCGAGGERGGW